MKLLNTLFFVFFSFFCFGQIINDESYKDQSFWEFKNELENCILKKDTTLLKTFLADHVSESYYGCNLPECTKEKFIKYCFAREGADEIWNNMATLLRYGFHQTHAEHFNASLPYIDTTFQAPSFLKTLNRDKKILVLGEKVNIREKPSLNAKVLKQATYETFKCDCNTDDVKNTTFQIVEGIEWLEIYLENGTIGYIAVKFTSYMISKEMSVSKINGEWKLVSFYQPVGC